MRGIVAVPGSMVGSLGRVGLGAIRSEVSTGAESRIDGKLAEWVTKGLERDGLVQLSVADL